MSEQTIGRAIKLAYRRAGLSQAELARLVGVSQPLVSAWASDKSEPDLKQVRAIEDACGVGRTLLAAAGYAAPPGDVIASLLSDPLLSSQSRQSLVEAYLRHIGDAVNQVVVPDTTIPEVKTIMDLDRFPYSERLRMVASIQLHPRRDDPARDREAV